MILSVSVQTFVLGVDVDHSSSHNHGVFASTVCDYKPFLYQNASLVYTALDESS